MQVKSIAECSPLEHSATLPTFIKLPVAIKIYVLSIFEWPFYTGFTVVDHHVNLWLYGSKCLCHVQDREGMELDYTGSLSSFHGRYFVHGLGGIT